MDEPQPPPPEYNPGGDGGESGGKPSGGGGEGGNRFSFGFMRTPPGICMVVNIVSVNRLVTLNTFLDQMYSLGYS